MRMSRLEGLFAGLGLTIGVSLAWSYLDRPLETGYRVHGSIQQCRGTGARGPRWCLVKTDDGHTVTAAIPHGQPLDVVTLTVSKRRLSRQLFYEVDLSAGVRHAPNPDPQSPTPR